MAAEVATATQPTTTKSDSDPPAGLEQFKKRLNALAKKVGSAGGDGFSSPKGAGDGVVAWNPPPGDQWDIFFLYKPEGGDDDRVVEVHMTPSKNPRKFYDQEKEASLKPDSWDQIIGWVENPSGYPSRNDYDDIRMCALEEKQPYHVRWVQHKQGDAGGYFVRLETTYIAPKDYLKECADAVWHIVHQAGYFNPAH